MIEKDTRAVVSFYREVRRFAELTKPWETAIRHEVAPDEVYQLPLVSSRVYGNIDEWFTVMAAAGLGSVDQPLTQRLLTLPTSDRINRIKRKTGYESLDRYRKDFSPTWKK